MKTATKKKIGFFIELNGLGVGGVLMGNAWGLWALLVTVIVTTVAVIVGEFIWRRRGEMT